MCKKALTLCIRDITYYPAYRIIFFFLQWMITYFSQKPQRIMTFPLSPYLRTDFHGRWYPRHSGWGVTWARHTLKLALHPTMGIAAGMGGHDQLRWIRVWISSHIARWRLVEHVWKGSDIFHVIHLKIPISQDLCHDTSCKIHTCDNITKCILPETNIAP